MIKISLILLFYLFSQNDQLFLMIRNFKGKNKDFWWNFWGKNDWEIFLKRKTWNRNSFLII